MYDPSEGREVRRTVSNTDPGITLGGNIEMRVSGSLGFVMEVTSTIMKTSVGDDFGDHNIGDISVGAYVKWIRRLGE